MAKKTGPASRQAKAAVSPEGSLIVDLHIEAIPGGTKIPKGQQLQFQMDTFRKIVRINISHKGRKITFIHGIGDGILKAAIRKELDEVLALRCSYCVGDPASFSFFICFSTPLSVIPTSTDSSKVVIVKIY